MVGESLESMGVLQAKILDSIVAEAAAASEPGAAAQVNITLVFYFLIKLNKMISEHPSLATSFLYFHFWHSGKKNCFVGQKLH